MAAVGPSSPGEFYECAEEQEQQQEEQGEQQGAAHARKRGQSYQPTLSMLPEEAEVQAATAAGAGFVAATFRS